jgi:hypothetical protein
MTMQNPPHGQRVRRHGRRGQIADLADRRRLGVLGSVPYYLRTYALQPDPVFVDHIRQRRYLAPTVNPAKKQAAPAAISGGNRPTCRRRGGRSVIVDHVDREFGRPGLVGER